MIFAKIEQNKKNAAMFFTAMIFLIIAFFSSPVFAASYYPSTLTVAPVCDLTQSSFDSNGFLVSYLTRDPDGVNRSIIGSYYDPDSGNLVLVTSFLTSDYVYFVRSYDPDVDGDATLYRSYNGELSSTSASRQDISEDLKVAYRRANRSSTYTQLGPVYDSLEDGCAAASALFAGYVPPEPSSSYALDYSLPPGNVAFVELTSASSEASFSTTMPVLSSLFGSSWVNVTQKWGYSDTIPSFGSSVSTSSLTTFSWTKVAPFNVLRQSKNGTQSFAISSGSRYLVVYNPLYFYVRDGGNGVESKFLDNGYINIRVNDVSSIVVLSLTSTALIGPTATADDSIESTVTAPPVTQSIDPDTGLPVWTDADGNPTSPPSVGSGNIASNGTTIFDVLQNIANSIKDFFGGAVGAIQTLIAAGSAFVSSLVLLYSWLPGSVLSVLSSALVLVITIGVIKVFL